MYQTSYHFSKQVNILCSVTVQLTISAGLNKCVSDFLPCFEVDYILGSLTVHPTISPGLQNGKNVTWVVLIENVKNYI